MGDSVPPINVTPELIDYGLQKFLKLFGQDSESKELADWFKGLQETAVAQTSKVHCLGMLTPCLSIRSISQRASWSVKMRTNL